MMTIVSGVGFLLLTLAVFSLFSLKFPKGSEAMSGMANAACEVFDAKQWDNVVGTLSGDDTFFILMRSEDDAAAICKQLQQYTRRG